MCTWLPWRGGYSKRVQQPLLGWLARGRPAPSARRVCLPACLLISHASSAVSTALCVGGCACDGAQVGLQLRNDDPALMKEFVLQVHTRAAELGKAGEHACMHASDHTHFVMPAMGHVLRRDGCGRGCRVDGQGLSWVGDAWRADVQDPVPPAACSARGLAWTRVAVRAQ